MTRYIDADELDSVVLRMNEEGAQITRGEYKLINSVIYEFHTIDAEPVRHGHWIKEFENEDGRNLRCSECRMVFFVGKGRDGNYCPECGARMDEK